MEKGAEPRKSDLGNQHVGPPGPGRTPLRVGRLVPALRIQARAIPTEAERAPCRPGGPQTPASAPGAAPSAACTFPAPHLREWLVLGGLLGSLSSSPGQRLPGPAICRRVWAFFPEGLGTQTPRSRFRGVVLRLLAPLPGLTMKPWRPPQLRWTSPFKKSYQTTYLEKWVHTCVHVFSDTHIPDSSPHSCLHLPPLPAPTRYVLEQIQVACAVHQLSRTSVTNLREGRKQLFGQRLEALAAGAALRDAPHPSAAPAEKGPCRSQMISETAGTSGRRAPRRGPKCARWGCSAVSLVLRYPPWPFVLIPPPTRLGAGASPPPPLSSSTGGEGLRRCLWSGARRAGAGVRARRGGGARQAQSWGAAPCPSRKPREQARPSCPFRDKEEGRAAFSYK